VNYVPVREHLDDLAEQVDWLIANPAAAKCIQQGQEAFANRILMREVWAGYIWRLLSTFKKFQPFESRTDGFHAI
jgi:hypothetical protein